mgnify:CR=1 FL=1
MTTLLLPNNLFLPTFPVLETSSNLSGLKRKFGNAFNIDRENSDKKRFKKNNISIFDSNYLPMNDQNPFDFFNVADIEDEDMEVDEDMDIVFNHGIDGKSFYLNNQKILDLCISEQHIVNQYLNNWTFLKKAQDVYDNHDPRYDSDLLDNLRNILNFKNGDKAEIIIKSLARDTTPSLKIKVLKNEHDNAPGVDFIVCSPFENCDNSLFSFHSQVKDDSGSLLNFTTCEVKVIRRNSDGSMTIPINTSLLQALYNRAAGDDSNVIAQNFILVEFGNSNSNSIDYKVYIVNWNQIISHAMIQYTTLSNCNTFFQNRMGNLFGDIRNNYNYLGNGSTNRKASLEVSGLINCISPVNGSGQSNSFDLYQRLTRNGK